MDNDGLNISFDNSGGDAGSSSVFSHGGGFGDFLANMGQKYTSFDTGLSELFGESNLGNQATWAGTTYTPMPSTSNMGGDPITNGDTSGDTSIFNNPLTGVTNPTQQNLLDAIREQYANVESGLDDRLSGVGDFGNDLSGNLGNWANSMRTGITSAADASKVRLGGMIDKVKEGKKLTMRDLSEDVMNSMKAGGRMLGSIGAADSSAAPMFQYAISKGGNRRSADVTRQVNDRVASIDLAIEDVTNKATQALTQVDQWYAEQNQKVMTYIEGLKENLRGYKGSIDEAKLADAQEKYINAREYMEQVGSYKSNIQNQVASSVTAYTAELNAYKSQIDNSGATLPMGISTTGINMPTSISAKDQRFAGGGQPSYQSYNEKDLKNTSWLS